MINLRTSFPGTESRLHYFEEGLRRLEGSSEITDAEKEGALEYVEQLFQMGRRAVASHSANTPRILEIAPSLAFEARRLGLGDAVPSSKSKDSRAQIAAGWLKLDKAPKPVHS